MTLIVEGWTAAQLIAELSKLPPETIVMVGDLTEGTVKPIELCCLRGVGHYDNKQLFIEIKTF